MASADSPKSLADLDHWTFTGTALAVVGHPIQHSLSPVMHNAALTELAKTNPAFASWRYFKFDIAPEDLGLALKKFRSNHFRGLNLTVPHKVLAFDQIDGIDPAAKPIGAVNTLLSTPDGWQGFNTDGYGLATGLREDLHVDLSHSDIILLGAGGAARGAAVECLQQRCRSLWIANRTAANLESLLASLRPLAAGIPLNGFAPDKPPAGLPAGAVVINTTSAGLHEHDNAPVDLTSLPGPRAVYDAIYNPPRTKLLQQAETLGIANANGLSMLIHQGARALSLWTGAAVPVGVMSAAARTALGR